MAINERQKLVSNVPAPMWVAEPLLYTYPEGQANAAVTLTLRELQSIVGDSLPLPTETTRKVITNTPNEMLLVRLLPADTRVVAKLADKTPLTITIKTTSKVFKGVVYDWAEVVECPVEAAKTYFVATAFVKDVP